MGGRASGPSIDPAAVFSGSAVFSNYGRAAVITYVISDVALAGAVLAYIFLDLAVAIAFGGVAIVLTLIALRCGQVVFSRRLAEDKIETDETVLAELGARRDVRVSLLRSPSLLIFTDRRLYVLDVSIFGVGRQRRLAYQELHVVTPDDSAGTLRIAASASRNEISLVAIKSAELQRAIEVLNEVRPGIVSAHVH